MSTTQNKKSLEHRGYLQGLSVELDFAKAISDKMKVLAKAQPTSKWKSLLEGFKLGLAEQLKDRKQELSKAKGQEKGKSQGRKR